MIFVPNALICYTSNFEEKKYVSAIRKGCFFSDILLYYWCHTHRASMRNRIAYFGEFFCLLYRRGLCNI